MGHTGTQLNNPDEIIRWLQQPAWAAEILEAVLTSLEEERNGRFEHYDTDTRMFIFKVSFQGESRGYPYDIFKATETLIIDMIYAESTPQGKLKHWSFDKLRRT